MNAWYDSLKEPWRLLLFMALILPLILVSNTHPYLAVVGILVLFVLRLLGGRL